MSKRVALRLPDDLLAFVDGVVSDGGQPDRAAVVTRALERERRRVIAERDVQILAADNQSPDLVGLAEHVESTPRELN